jgi:hypothetical protein
MAGTLGLLLLAAAAAADEPEVLVELERDRIYEGESVLYRVTLNHVENPSPPKLEGFEAFAIQSRGEQSLNSEQVTIINGRVTRVVRYGRAYDYLLTPKQAGVLTVPAPTAVVDGKTLRGETCKLRVIAPQEQDNAILTVQIDPPAVYPTQSFTVTLKIAVKSLPEPHADRDPVAVLRRPPALAIPWIPDERLPDGVEPHAPWQRWLGQYQNRRDAGFSVNNIGSGSALALFDDGPAGFLPEAKRTDRQDKSGRTVGYWEYAFARTCTAKRIGEYAFGPVTLKGGFVTRVKTDGRLEGEEIYAVARPTKLVVKDVPTEGRPDSYTGAIGEFEFTSQLSPTTVKVGDPMTLTLSLRGRGTLDAVKTPDLAQIPEVAQQFKIYEATEQTREGERTFTYGLRPLAAGDQNKFPSVPLTYFDVRKEAFVTLHTEEIPVRVTPAEQLASQQIALAGAPPASRQEVETREGGIFANDSALGSLRDDSVRPARWLTALAGVLGLYVAVVWSARRFQRFQADPQLRRRRAAARRARERLQAAKAAGGRQEAEALQAAVIGLVADATGLAEAALTSAEVRQRLLDLGIDAPLVDRVARWFEACDAARYGASQQALQGLEDTADTLLDELVAAFRQRRITR